MSSSQTLPVLQAEVVSLQSRVHNLEQENAALLASKMKLITATSSEMDRLRRYIHALTRYLHQSHDDDPGTVPYPIYEVEEKSVSPPKQDTVTRGGDVSCPFCGGATNVSNNYYFQMVTSPNDEDNIDEEPGPGGMDGGSHHYQHVNMTSELHVDPREIQEAKEYIPSTYPNDGHRDSHHLQQESHQMQMNEEVEDEKQVILNDERAIQQQIQQQRRHSGFRGYQGHQHHHQSNHNHNGYEPNGYEPNAYEPNGYDHEPNGYGSGDDDADFSSDEEPPLGGAGNTMGGPPTVTPGRESVISIKSFMSGAGITPGNVMDDDDHFRSLGPGLGPLGEHSSIPVPDNLMDASFVICEDCTSNLPLQYVRPNKDRMQCTKCASYFECIFLCNTCGKSVCEECYQYEAKMQSMDRVMTHFVENEMDNDSERLIAIQHTISTQCASTLNQLVAEHCTALGINEFSLKLCYVICHFLYDTDLCSMLDVQHAADLLDIYWSLSPPKITFQRKFGFSDVRLLHSLKWADNTTDWKVKRVVEEDIMIQNYLTKDYSLITFDEFMRKLSKDMNETTTYERILDLLELITKCSDVKHAEMLNYNQFAWRELGGSPIPCSRATLFVWNLPLMRRSYCFNVENRILDRPWKSGK